MESNVLDEVQSEQINELVSALGKAQASMKPAKKTSENPFFKSSYADLAAVWHEVRKPLTDNNLVVIQTMAPNNGGVIIVTTLAHSSGQWIKSYLPIQPVKSDPQSLGSAITYGRRYSLAAIVGLVTEEEDDDAEGAMSRKRETPPTQSKTDGYSGKIKDPDSPRTDAQVKKIWATAKEIWGDEAALELQALIEEMTGKGKSSDMTKQEASDLIGKLEEMKKR